MNRYFGMKCPHCGKAFKEQDSATVCPDCGAPYHRSCFEEMNGVCMFQDRHAEGYDWNEAQEKQQQRETERGYEDPRQLRCAQCGTLNSSENIFCDVCGNLLRGGETAGQQTQQQAGYSQQRQAGFGFGGFGAAPYTAPYSGLNPDEEIDGIPVKDLAIYVGENSQYYLPKFKDLKTNRRNVINWSAFLLEFVFLVYRKMYLVAALVFFIPLLIDTAALLLLTGGNILTLTAEHYTIFSTISYGVSFLVRFLVGMSFNRLYQKRCFKKIRALKEQHGDTPGYFEALTRNGSVSRKGVYIVCGIYLAVNIAIMYISAFSGII